MAVHLIFGRSNDATHCEPQAVILCSVILMEQGGQPNRSPLGRVLE
jgi:hypothetical protein